jgi:hypothetical protein
MILRIVIRLFFPFSFSGSLRRRFAGPLLHPAQNNCDEQGRELHREYPLLLGRKGPMPITEQDWLAATEPLAMLDHLRGSGKVLDRQLRLFGAACSRRIGGLLDEQGRRAVEVAELYADGLASREKLRTARLACKSAGSNASWYAAASSPGVAARNAALSAQTGSHRQAEQMAQAALLRCIFGNPFRDMPAILSPCLSWNGGLVVKLAAAAYEERDFSLSRMMALAAALQEAGCGSEEILGHCRQQDTFHCRGCWVVDLVLRK